MNASRWDRRNSGRRAIAGRRRCRRALLCIGLGRPVATAHVGEAARGKAVDDQGDVTPVAQKPGHARGVLPRAAAAVEDRDRGEAAVARRTEELRGKIEALCRPCRRARARSAAPAPARSTAAREGATSGQSCNSCENKPRSAASDDVPGARSPLRTNCIQSDVVLMHSQHLELDHWNSSPACWGGGPKGREGQQFCRHDPSARCSQASSGRRSRCPQQPLPGRSLGDRLRRSHRKRDLRSIAVHETTTCSAWATAREACWPLTIIRRISNASPLGRAPPLA